MSGSDRRLLPAEVHVVASAPPFVLPSVSGAPIGWNDALAAVLGYARAKRLLPLRTPSYPDGHVVRVPAFSYGVYDCVPTSEDDGFAWLDVLVVDGLNGRLRQSSIVALKDAGERAWKHVHRADVRSGGQAFWELPIEEVIPPEPSGSTGAALCAAWGECMSTDDIDVALTHKVLYHKRPRLFPLIDRRTAPRLEDQARLNPGGLWAVIHRELTENAESFDALESALNELLAWKDGVRLERLRLHDILLWLDVTEQRSWAAEEGRKTAEWHEWSSRPDDGIPGRV